MSYLEDVKLRIANIVLDVNADFMKAGRYNPSLLELLKACKAKKAYRELELDVAGLTLHIDDNGELVIVIPNSTLN